MAARLQGTVHGRQGLPGLPHVEEKGIQVLLVDPLLQGLVMDDHVGALGAQAEVFPRMGDQADILLVGVDPAPLPHGPGEHRSERSGPGARLGDPLARKDVHLHEDVACVLGIDDLGVPLEPLQHEVVQVARQHVVALAAQLEAASGRYRRELPAADVATGEAHRSGTLEVDHSPEPGEVGDQHSFSEHVFHAFPLSCRPKAAISLLRIPGPRERRPVPLQPLARKKRRLPCDVS